MSILIRSPNASKTNGRSIIIMTVNFSRRSARRVCRPCVCWAARVVVVVIVFIVVVVDARNCPVKWVDWAFRRPV